MIVSILIINQAPYGCFGKAVSPEVGNAGPTSLPPIKMLSFYQHGGTVNLTHATVGSSM